MDIKSICKKNPIILVVDDSKYMRTVLRQFLENNNYEVIEADDGKEALLKYQNFKPDLILMDYVMPGMDGVTAVKELRKLLDSNLVPVIMVTSLGDEKSVNDAFEAGATDYIGKPINFAVLKHRINRLVKARFTELSLIKSEKYAQSIIKNALDGIIMVDMCGKIKAFNPSAEKIFDYKSAEMVGKEIKGIIPKFYCDKCGDCFSIEQYIDGKQKKGISWEINGLKKDGTSIPLELSVSNFDLGDQMYYAIILRDITTKQRYEKKIRYQAFYDNITGIPNRLLLKERLSLEVSRCKISEEKLAVVYLDLDRFKLINDTLGHNIGDELLKFVAHRLKEILSKNDTIARMGGDEFAILLPSIEREEDAAKVATRVLESLREPFVLNGHELFITASMGIAFCPCDGDEVDKLIKNADIAMYRAKEKGKNNFQLYTMSMNDKALERLEMEGSLRRALENKEFIIHYQPKINSESKDIVGFEALIRWQHPELGLVPPGQFIPLAEETGLILGIGDWVLREACLQAKQWQDEGFTNLHVAVNLSSKQFQLQNLTNTISKALAETGLEPRFLELEITESVAMQDVEYTLKVMQDLKQMGIKFSIDDFGTGYSSLSYLKKFTINKLKIDRSFVSEIGSKKDDRAIASTIIALAKSLNLGIVAEGVENQSQYDFLKDSKCDEMQGYLFGKPMPPLEFKRLLDSKRELLEPNQTFLESKQIL